MNPLMLALAYAFGRGLGSGLLFFSLTYLAMSRRFGFKFSNLKIIGLLLLAAPFIGTIQLVLAPGSEPSYVSIFSTLGVPIIVSAAIIFVAHKARAKKLQPDLGNL